MPKKSKKSKVGGSDYRGNTHRGNTHINNYDEQCFSHRWPQVPTVGNYNNTNHIF